MHEILGCLQSRKILVIVIACFCFQIHPGISSGNDTESLAGEAFTDPGYVFNMGPNWDDIPLQYNSLANNASLKISLDQHLYPALLPIINGFRKSRKISIAVQEGTCGISAGLLAKKRADITGFCCPPGLSDRLPDLDFHTIGIAGLAVLVNSRNPINDITLEQARGIFQGKYFYWSEIVDSKGIKGLHEPIWTIGRLHCKNRPGHWRLLLDNEDLFSPRLHEVGTINDMISSVAKHKGSIGFEVVWNIDRYNQGPNIKVLHINGYSPTNEEHLVKNLYPLYRCYNITTWSGPNSKLIALDLLRFIEKHKDKIDKKHGIVFAHQLKKAGWKFKGNELVGSPRQ